jgi:hypothetical protein
MDKSMRSYYDFFLKKLAFTLCLFLSRREDLNWNQGELNVEFSKKTPLLSVKISHLMEKSEENGSAYLIFPETIPLTDFSLRFIPVNNYIITILSIQTFIKY